jgi:7-carboxy-7-deazaguanine synthase
MKIKIYSIFPSIDGEVNGSHQGRMSVFIRFAGCNIRCEYCDTGYALEKKSATSEMTPQEIMDVVESYGINKVTITGGEPLMQPAGLHELCKLLYWKNFLVSVETNGSLPLEGYGYGIGSWVVDYKLPSSGCMDRMNPDTFLNLRANDFVKFVIEDELDFNTALLIRTWLKDEHELRVQFAFSPVHGKLSADSLIAWLMKAGVGDAIINVQLHKILNLKENK